MPSRSGIQDLVGCVDRRLEEVVEVRGVVANLAAIEAVLELTTR